MKLVTYIDVDVEGRRPFSAWLLALSDRDARKRILARVEAGNLGDYKPVRDGVLELRIDHGPATASISAARGRSSCCCSVAVTRAVKPEPSGGRSTI